MHVRFMRISERLYQFTLKPLFLKCVFLALSSIILDIFFNFINNKGEKMDQTIRYFSLLSSFCLLNPTSVST